MIDSDEPVSVAATGVHVQSEDRTGWAAWAAVRREYPAVAWAVPACLLALGVLPVLVALAI
ncbi:hypothetical protein AB0J21_05875 [Streptomyces sp. NPDC049954]|uniref:hypothetical protein n=1 Tax=Streptomyces sp. NPDC049954 TaxID=3155779 RepID=UPI0034201D37